jgi:hypothetical protein
MGERWRRKTMRREKCGMWNVECGMRNVECGMRILQARISFHIED